MKHNLFGHHKIICPPESLHRDGEPVTWEQQMAKRYYDKLFKEYCLADLSRYREGLVALRWRTEKEVLEGKGGNTKRL